MPVIKYKNRCIKFKNKAAEVPNWYELTLYKTNGGLLSSNKLSGWWNDEITLYNTPSAHYDFSGYSITGSTLYDNNKFKFNDSNVSAEAIFTPWPVRNVSLVQTIGGTINATPMTGYDGDTVVLTNTPEQGYDFISYELTGSTLYDDNKFDFNGNNVSVKSNFKKNYNPLNLPAYTIRVQLTDTSYDCSDRGFKGTWVSRGNGIWDITYVNSNWSRLMTDTIGFWGRRKVHRLLGMNSSGVTNMERFEDCAQQYLIGTIPIFDTTLLTDVTNAFYETFYVEGGQLALYQQMSTQANPPTNHNECFNSCGRNSTDASKAETSQIASDWK